MSRTEVLLQPAMQGSGVVQPPAIQTAVEQAAQSLVGRTWSWIRIE